MPKVQQVFERVVLASIWLVEHYPKPENGRCRFPIYVWSLHDLLAASYLLRQHEPATKNLVKRTNDK